jgi:hypothetical protein
VAPAGVVLLFAAGQRFDGELLRFQEATGQLDVIVNDDNPNNEFILTL